MSSEKRATTTPFRDASEIPSLKKTLQLLDYIDSTRKSMPTPKELAFIVHFFLSLPKVELDDDMRTTSRMTSLSRDETHIDELNQSIEEILFIRPIYLDDEELVTNILQEVKASPGLWTQPSLTENKIWQLIEKIFQTSDYGGFIAFIDEIPVGIGLLSTLIGTIGRVDVYIKNTFGLTEVAHGLVGELIRLAMVFEFKSLFCKINGNDNNKLISVLRMKGFFAATDEEMKPLFERINEPPDETLYILPKVPRIPRLRRRRG